MFYNQDPQAMRQVFFDAWEKYLHQRPLSDLEKEIAMVIAAHPEYHHLLQDKTHAQTQFAENNPFLHMGLHLAIREQIATDRPTGIHAIAQQLLQKYQDPTQVEHRMMDCLADSLWLAQKNKQMPDEHSYLQTLASLL
jgi:hypothetical protein